MSVQTINEVITAWVAEGAPPEVLVSRLYAREDAMVEVMHLAGVQFGLFPQIVAEVLAEVGIGSPVSAEQRQLIRDNFNRLMEQLAREHGLGE